MREILTEVLARYELGGRAALCERYGCGHINETYLVTAEGGGRFILQKINEGVFRDVDALMSNIEAVTSWLRERSGDPRSVMDPVRSRDGELYVRPEGGGAWRVYRFVPDSLCLQRPESPADFYESAVAFGRFQELLSDFPAETLAEVIPRFHDTPDRYRLFHRALERDPLGRAKGVRPEIEAVLRREKEASLLTGELKSGAIPLRVTHNDTKLNNVLLDAGTRKALCVIDLDTVMPGSSLYDFGDSIRFGASAAAEDERDLGKVGLDLELFSIYTRGFLSACRGLTKREKELLPEGARLMTLECGVRFLTDYLEGDHYFATGREGQNLDRCRTQLKLTADMEEKRDQMRERIGEIEEEIAGGSDGAHQSLDRGYAGSGRARGGGFV